MNTVHPTALIGDDVVLGDGNTIGAFAVLSGTVSIGDDNWIGAGAVIGAPPEVRQYPHPRSFTETWGNGVAIGDRNIIREYAQIHQGWKGRTQISDDTFVMNQCYVAHDSRLENGVTLASSVLLAGHVHVGAGANLGLGASVHQFCRIGDGSMVGMGSVVVKEIPPFAKAFGNPASVRGANTVGLERSGVDEGTIRALAELYRGLEESTDASRQTTLLRIADVGVRDAVRRWIDTLSL